MHDCNALVHNQVTRNKWTTVIPWRVYSYYFTACETHRLFKIPIILISAWCSAVSNFSFFRQDVTSYEMDDDDCNDGVVPQRRGQVSQPEQEDLVVKGKAFAIIYDLFLRSTGICM